MSPQPASAGGASPLQRLLVQDFAQSLQHPPGGAA
jgi:hypothetical protein